MSIGLGFGALALGGCDSSAKSSGPLEPAPRADGESKRYESCSTSSDCEGALRCVDAQCRSRERSVLGDYYAAAGRKALAAGENDQAVNAYNKAITEYEKGGSEPPADLFCEQGRALAQDMGDKQKGEAAARVLHRCVLALPAGSELARAALDDLARLADAGLDPSLLARSEPADLYLTREPNGPSFDDLQVTVSGDSKNRRKSHAALVAALSDAANRSKLGACFEPYHKATKSDSLSVELEFSYKLIWDEDDESNDRAVLTLEPGEGASGAGADASRCVEAVAATVAEETARGLREDSRWKAAIKVSMSL